MIGFGGVFGRKPRQFSYRPRYYDPEKEARNQRRRELGLAVPDEENQEKKPGDMLRNKIGLTRQRFEEERRDRKSKSTKLALVVVVMFIVLIWLLLDIF